jgi:rubredoxin
MKCKARQYSDQMNCHKCGLVWDTNDPQPPKCPLEQGRSPARKHTEASVQIILFSVCSIITLIIEVLS